MTEVQRVKTFSATQRVYFAYLQIDDFSTKKKLLLFKNKFNDYAT